MWRGGSLACDLRWRIEDEITRREEFQQMSGQGAGRSSMYIVLKLPRIKTHRVVE